MKVWDAQTGQEILTLKAPTSFGGSIAFGADAIGWAAFLPTAQ